MANDGTCDQIYHTWILYGLHKNQPTIGIGVSGCLSKYFSVHRFFHQMTKNTLLPLLIKWASSPWLSHTSMKDHLVPLAGSLADPKKITAWGNQGVGVYEGSDLEATWFWNQNCYLSTTGAYAIELKGKKHHTKSECIFKKMNLHTATPNLMIDDLCSKCITYKRNDQTANEKNIIP